MLAFFGAKKCTSLQVEKIGFEERFSKKKKFCENEETTKIFCDFEEITERKDKNLVMISTEIVKSGGQFQKFL